MELDAQSVTDGLSFVQSSPRLLCAPQDGPYGVLRQTRRNLYGKSIRIQRFEALGDKVLKGFFSMFHESEKIPKRCLLDYR